MSDYTVKLHEYSKKVEGCEKAVTTSGIEVDPLYLPKELDDDYMENIGLPGSYPFVRGVYPAMYRQRLWTMRQYAGFGSPEESNSRYKYLLEQGQTGLSVAFDLPTQMGYDSDDPFVKDEVGKVGVAIDTLADMEAMFDGIPLDRISTSFTINATAPIIMAMYIAICEKNGVPKEKIRGTMQNDILKEYYARNTYIYPPESSLRLSTDIIEYCAENAPKFNPISVCGYHVREAGADAIQEVALSIAAGLEYIDRVLKRGIPIDSFAPQISFNISSGIDIFEEICKHRACRKIWAKLIRERYAPEKDRSCCMRFFSGGSGAGMAAKEPFNNIIRATLQTLVVVLGGAQACHVMAYDEPYATPSEESARLALRTQQIIAYESGIPRTADPLGGSYYIEALTKKIEDGVMELLSKLDKEGGIVNAILSGMIEREVFKRAYDTERKIDDGEKVIVGVNKFVTSDTEEFSLQSSDPERINKKIGQLKNIKVQRDNAKVEKCLDELKAAAKTDKNLMPFMLEAVKAYCSVGEISETLKEVFGVHVRKNIF